MTPTTPSRSAQRWTTLCGGRGKSAPPGSDVDALNRALSALFSDKSGAQGRLHAALGRGPASTRLLESELTEGATQTFEDAFVAAAALDPSLIWDALALPNLEPETRRRLLDLIRRALAELMRLIRPRFQRSTATRSPIARRTRRPRPQEINWISTIGANLSDYVPERKQIAPHKFLGATRRARRADLEDLIVCIDQSGSMIPATIPALICAALLGASASVRTRIVLFDVRIIDVSEIVGALARDDETQFIEGLLDALLKARGVLGGGTNIGAAAQYCADLVQAPEKSHFILVSDLFDGTPQPQSFLSPCLRLARAGVNVQIIAPLEAGCCAASATTLRAAGCNVRQPSADRLVECLAEALRRR